MPPCLSSVILVGSGNERCHPIAKNKPLVRVRGRRANSSTMCSYSSLIGAKPPVITASFELVQPSSNRMRDFQVVIRRLMMTNFAASSPGTLCTMRHSDQNLNVFMRVARSRMFQVCLTINRTLIHSIDSQELFHPRVNEQCVDDTNCDEHHNTRPPNRTAVRRV
jgi:hypothetical protein